MNKEIPGIATNTVIISIEMPTDLSDLCPISRKEKHKKKEFIWFIFNR